MNVKFRHFTFNPKLQFSILNSNAPLAEKLRPKTLDQVLGQEHLTGKNGPIRKMLENDTLNSLIFWDRPELVRQR